jgi:hypothetical protein
MAARGGGRFHRFRWSNAVSNRVKRFYGGLIGLLKQPSRNPKVFGLTSTGNAMANQAIGKP